MGVPIVDDVISGLDSLADTVFSGIDSISTSDKERLKIKQQVQKQIGKLKEKALDVKVAQIEAKAGIIKASKETPFWKNWRGLVMLGVFVLAVIHAVFPSVAYFSSDQITALLKWGLGGYIGVEGALGIARHGAPAIAERERRKAEQEREKTRRYDKARAEMSSASAPTVPQPPSPKAPKSGPQTVAEARKDPQKVKPAPPDRIGW
ncbi:hypothetical protein [Salinibacter phage M31CR41-2]|uniref:Holin of 3TMs, for gene-transfer release n=1 Tax=Salinibacter phage M31CR41-2 TaxID=2681614 RepID=A0A2I6UH29_9CAUD|nr:hypothetical protein FGG68_gp52 [Salinibacter phage M31CR41-2]AUO79280.1 hypothetical protein [Salinibacter phage M31CR41-2]